jgi:hypothetical protein
MGGTMKRVYVAGKLNASAVDYIKNVHKMIVWAEKVRKAGFAVYIPAIDLLAGIVHGNFSYDDYFNNSQFWLDASDAVFLVPGWEDSDGTKREIRRATKQYIPCFTDIDKMKADLSIQPISYVI